MIGLIFAQSSNGFIGKDGKLLFHIPEDLKRFKHITEGSAVVMGRKTWESLPDGFKPLPNRFNVVLSRNKDYKIPGVLVHHDLVEVLSRFENKHQDIWIIGGEELYKEAIRYARIIQQTLVTQEFDGDAKAPYIDPDNWQCSVGNPFKEHNGLYYQFNTYRRK